MSGQKQFGERDRCPINGNGRRLSRSDMSAIRRAIDIANSQAQRKGKKPRLAQIAIFTCACHCFSVHVE